MRPRRTIILTLSLIIIAAAAFAMTLAVRARAQVPATTSAPTTGAATSKLLSWLGVPQAQWPEIEKHDPTFAADQEKLRADLAARRTELADAMEKADATDEAIRRSSEALMAADNAAQRRVIDHLLLIRDHLTAQQQQRLLGVCANEVRRGQGWQWRRGQDGQGGPGRGQGGGGQGGRGAGGGRGGPPWQ